jgi:hypothetical protein
VLALRIPAIFATSAFSFERLLLVVAFVSVCGYLFCLGTVDLLLWVHETEPWDGSNGTRIGCGSSAGSPLD